MMFVLFLHTRRKSEFDMAVDCGKYGIFHGGVGRIFCEDKALCLSSRLCKHCGHLKMPTNSLIRHGDLWYKDHALSAEDSG
jgi:hypothetical protein